MLLRLFFPLLLLSACATDRVTDDEIETGGIPAIWEFTFTDRDASDLGTIRLAFTDEPADDGYCAGRGLRKAHILEDNLDFDLGMDKQPAYRFGIRWMELDLTATSCNVNFLLLGNFDASSSSGIFNYAHPLGGDFIGRFSAVPVNQATR